MERKRFLKLAGSILLVIVLMALALGGCVKPVEEAKPINIGLACGFTGPGAMEFLRGADLIKGIVADVNAAGGINGRQIKLFVADDANDPAKVMGNLKRFYELNNCTSMCILGTSTANYAAKQWAEENHVPCICGNAQSGGLLSTEKIKEWWFSCCPHTRHYSGGMCVRAKEMGYTKVGIEYSTLAWGLQGMEILRDQFFPEYGLECTGTVALEPKSKDATIQVKELRDTGAEMIMMIEYAAEMNVWARAMKELAWDVYCLNMSGGMTFESIKIGPAELYEDWEVVLMSDIGKPACLKVWDKLEEVKGERLEDVSMTGYWDEIHILMEAIKLSGNPDDPEAIRDALYKVKVPMSIGREGAIATYELGKNCTVTPEDVAIGVVKSGKIVSLN